MAETRQPEAESTQPGTRLNPVVFFGSAACVLAIAVWAMVSPQGASDALGVVVGWISEWFGWFYILIATGLLTLAVLVVGGITALQNATIVMGLPFGFVMVLLMFGLYKALRVEAIREDSQRYSLPAQLSGRHNSPDGDRSVALTWQQRLGRSMSFPSRERASAFLSEVALPALNEVAEELRSHGVRAEVIDGDDGADLPYVELAADLGEETPFVYRIAPREAMLPIFGDQSLREGDVYYRLDVYLREGGQGYDVMGYTHSQLIDDVLDQYEQHVEFVRLSAEATRQTR